MATNNQQWRMSDGDDDERWQREQMYLRAEDADEQAAMRASGYLDDLDDLDDDERDENEFGGDLEDEDELDDDETEIEDLDEFRDPATIPVSNPEPPSTVPSVTVPQPASESRPEPEPTPTAKPKSKRKSKSSRKSKPKPKPASVRVSKSGVRRPASKKKKGAAKKH